MSWNNKDLFVSSYARKETKINNRLIQAIAQDSRECYGISPTDFEDLVHQPSIEQEKQYLSAILDIDFGQDSYE